MPPTRLWPGLIVIQVAFVMLAGTAFGCQGPTLAPGAGQATPAPDPDSATLPPRNEEPQPWSFRQHYDKHQYLIPMRDGVQLFTAVYTPKDTSQDYPLILLRTPYSIAPYGEDSFPDGGWGPEPPQEFAEEGYIFAYQDVRGCFMSEGQFVNMRPHIDHKTGPNEVDESSDTYDTIDWLVQNIPNNNGRVGMWGISYPGFYAAAGMIDAHPALKAVSPQAPIADWWYDDFHHHGAFCLMDAFDFFSVFGWERPELTTQWRPPFQFGTPDGYQFFLDLGPIKNANERYLHGNSPFWNKAIEHPNYDEFWQSRDILPHLKNVAPAVMTVGGWFDKEDLYGALNVYRAVERQNPDVFNILIMGPWIHGGWERTDGEQVGNIHFGVKTAPFFRAQIELPFFNHFLKDEGELDLPEAYVFETGRDRWRKFDHWPPAEAEEQTLYCHAGETLSFDPPTEPGDACDEYPSDPAKPVPYSMAISTRVTTAYMTDDQRFAAWRPDVLVYQTDAFEQNLTLAGPLVADLWVSTSGSASDWVVKLIDVYPPDAPDDETLPEGVHMGDYQMMVRSEVIRGRFRDSNEHPQPFVPDQPTRVTLPLQDVLHTFQSGHRLMVQIQSTWFPFIDRNPQKYVDNIYLADENDFIKATQRVYRSKEHPTRLLFNVLK